jgi:hypothetical protein
MGDATKILSEINKELRNADECIHTMTVLFSNRGDHARSREESSIIGYFLRLQKIIAKLVHDEKRAEELIRGTENLLLKRL